MTGTTTFASPVASIGAEFDGPLVEAIEADVTVGVVGFEPEGLAEAACRGVSDGIGDGVDVDGEVWG